MDMGCEVGDQVRLSGYGEGFIKSNDVALSPHAYVRVAPPGFKIGDWLM